MLEHRQADGVVAHVRREAQTLVGLHRIGAAILQLIGADLVQQADATALLPQVEQHAAPFGRDGLQRGLQLCTTVAAQAEQRVTGQAFGMQTAQHRLAVRHIAHRQRNMLLARILVEKSMHGEHAERRRQFGGSDENDRHGRNPRDGKADIVTSTRCGRA